MKDNLTQKRIRKEDLSFKEGDRSDLEYRIEYMQSYGEQSTQKMRKRDYIVAATLVILCFVGILIGGLL